MKLGWIYLLPSEAANVIVKYYPKWAVSCVLPKTKRRILVRFYNRDRDGVTSEELDIETPNLIMSHSMIKPWVLDSKVQPYFSLYAIDLKRSDGLYVTPYRLSNVYPSGGICFGDAVREIPSNLRQANNCFWGSPFNQDNCPFVKLHRNNCRDFDHEYYDHYNIEDYCECYFDDNEDQVFDGYEKECDCSPCECDCCRQICSCGCRCNLQSEFRFWITNYINQLKLEEYARKSTFFCGNKYFAYPNPVKAVFLSNNEELLKTIPKTSWRRDCQKDNVVIGVAIKNDQRWDIDLGSFQFSLEDCMVTTL